MSNQRILPLASSTKVRGKLRLPIWAKAVPLSSTSMGISLPTSLTAEVAVSGFSLTATPTTATPFEPNGSITSVARSASSMWLISRSSAQKTTTVAALPYSSESFVFLLPLAVGSSIAGSASPTFTRQRLAWCLVSSTGGTPSGTTTGSAGAAGFAAVSAGAGFADLSAAGVAAGGESAGFFAGVEAAGGEEAGDADDGGFD